MPQAVPPDRKGMSLGRRVYWGIGLLCAFAILGAFLFPGDRPGADSLPWRIEHPTPETTKIFGLLLRQSSPADAEQRFREKAEFALFKSPEGRLSAEAFFDQINLAGLRSKVVLTLDVDAAELARMHERGMRDSATLSGRKIAPAPEDTERLRSLPVTSLTLIPAVRVSVESFHKRFGVPTMFIREADAGVVHHLYPQHALGIAISNNASVKPVLQYVSPGDFKQLVIPLLEAGGKAESVTSR